MKKTSVYLSEDDADRLAWLARREGRSRAEILRQALTLYAQRATGAGDRNFAGAGIAEGPGGSIADVPEEEMLKGFGSDSYPGHRGDYRTVRPQ